MHLWRAIDDEGELLDLVVQPHPDAGAALRLLWCLLRNQPAEPKCITTDGLRSYGAEVQELGLSDLQPAWPATREQTGGNSHFPVRPLERQQQLSKSQACAQRFLNIHAAIYNTFYTERYLISRPTLRSFRGDDAAAWVVATA